MSYIVRGPTQSPIPNIFWAKVVSAPPFGASWARDEESPIPLYSLQTMQAKVFVHHGQQKRRPFRLTINGAVIVEVCDNEAEPFSESGGGSSGSSYMTGVSTQEQSIAVAAGGTPTLIAAADSGRMRGITVQNIGTNAVVIGKNAGIAADPIAGGQPSAILSGGAALSDGTGGIVTFDGWNGALWAITRDVLVGHLLVSAY